VNGSRGLLRHDRALSKSWRGYSITVIIEAMSGNPFARKFSHFSHGEGTKKQKNFSEKKKTFRFVPLAYIFNDDD
jgi:hypothetical protein